jgi:hypothetical protein
VYLLCRQHQHLDNGWSGPTYPLVMTCIPKACANHDVYVCAAVPPGRHRLNVAALMSAHVTHLTPHNGRMLMQAYSQSSHTSTAAGGKASRRCSAWTLMGWCTPRQVHTTAALVSIHLVSYCFSYAASHQYKAIWSCSNGLLQRRALHSWLLVRSHTPTHTYNVPESLALPKHRLTLPLTLRAHADRNL